MKPASNAFEVPFFGMREETFIDLHQCDACTMYAPNNAFTRYVWPKNSLPAKVLPTQIRRPDVQLCRGCNKAYGATVEANGYAKKDS
jgi:hypothetical protein